MPNKKIILERPHVRFDASTASVDGREERLFAPVVVMRMTRNSVDVGRDVGGPVAQVFR